MGVNLSYGMCFLSFCADRELGGILGAISLFIGAASPNKESLGATYGLSLVHSSVMLGVRSLMYEIGVRKHGEGLRSRHSQLTLLSQHREELPRGEACILGLLAAVWVSVVVASLLPQKLWVPKD